MYIEINKKKIDILELKTFWEKFKSLKFYLEPIDDIYRIKKRSLSTYLFCQRIDVIMTDKDNKILYIYNSLGSEKIIFPKKKVVYTYMLPVNMAKDFKIGDILKVKEKKQ